VDLSQRKKYSGFFLLKIKESGIKSRIKNMGVTCHYATRTMAGPKILGLNSLLLNRSLNLFKKQETLLPYLDKYVTVNALTK